MVILFFSKLILICNFLAISLQLFKKENNFIINLIIKINVKKWRKEEEINMATISMIWKMEDGALKFGLIDFQKDKFSGYFLMLNSNLQVSKLMVAKWRRYKKKMAESEGRKIQI